MRRPNKSGSVIKLPGKRRRPYAVRIYKGLEEVDGRAVNKYEYLEYFEKSTEAYKFLEKYNQSPVELVKHKEKEKKHRFSEVYEMWIEELGRRSKPLSQTSYNSYKAAYNNLKPLHNMIFENITLEDIENVALQHSSKSLSSITNMKVVLRGMYKTGLRHKFVSEDLTSLLIFEHADEKKTVHKPFSDKEIAVLWQHKEEFIPRLLLVLIYTGMRVNELLIMKSKDVHLEKRYMVGGLKTEAGKNRLIPISNKILDLLDVSHEYLITYNGDKISYGAAIKELSSVMEQLNMEHLFHDTRHTCASLMDSANIPEYHKKLILGHASADITDRYTHVSIETLIEDINTI